MHAGCAWDEFPSASASLTTVRRDDPPASQSSREAQVGTRERVLTSLQGLCTRKMVVLLSEKLEIILNTWVSQAVL